MVRSERKIHILTKTRIIKQQTNPFTFPKLNQKLTLPNQSARVPNPTSLLNQAPLAFKDNQEFLNHTQFPHLLRHSNNYFSESYSITFPTVSTPQIYPWKSNDAPSPLQTQCSPCSGGQSPRF